MWSSSLKMVIIRYCNGTSGSSVSAVLAKSPSLPFHRCVALTWAFWLWWLSVFFRFIFFSWLWQGHMGDLCHPKLQQWQSTVLLLIKKDTYASVVYPKAKLKKVVTFLYILDVLWCGAKAWQGVNTVSPPQVFALVNVLLTTCWNGMPA